MEYRSGKRKRSATLLRRGARAGLYQPLARIGVLAGKARFQPGILWNLIPSFYTATADFIDFTRSYTLT